jgi:hypothetical protein
LLLLTCLLAVKHVAAELETVYHVAATTALLLCFCLVKTQTQVLLRTCSLAVERVVVLEVPISKRTSACLLVLCAKKQHQRLLLRTCFLAVERVVVLKVFVSESVQCTGHTCCCCWWYVVMMVQAGMVTGQQQAPNSSRLRVSNTCYAQ